ncbi:MAG: histidine kinase N-terminal domain-containing protein, partial [Microbacteriaceae bacterium]
MTTLIEIANRHSTLEKSDLDWIQSLTLDWQDISDLAYSDLVLWIPTNDGRFVAVDQVRPSSSITLFYRDFIGKMIRDEWFEKVNEAYVSGRIVHGTAPDMYEHTPTNLRVIPVVRRINNAAGEVVRRTVGVMSAHTPLLVVGTVSRQEEAFKDAATDLFGMISLGDFPEVSASGGPRRGAPRVSDGLIRIDDAAVVEFASPNALSLFDRMGFDGELEGRLLPEAVDELLTGRITSDENLPLVVSGRQSYRTEIDAKGITMAIRSIPLKEQGERSGAILLMRDITELKSRERELITKDATIREIHHRVKNNLQTVASLLRIQARRTTSPEARESLTQAITRVGAIAVVHDTLSEGLSQNVNFDQVFDRVLMLVTEVASSHNTVVRPTKTGSFGVLPSEYATPLALALTELVTNAVEHGLAGREGFVEIIANRSDQYLEVRVRDNGAGLPEGQVGSGLGTQIVRTLIQGELSGTIDWKSEENQGTEVRIE